MGHSHDHPAGGHHPGGTGANLRAAFLLNLAFTAVEVAGGLWTNSVAILSDAVHDLGDSLSLGAAWYFERLSSRGAGANYTYGYRRYSLLGGLLTSLVLLVGLGFILWHAVPRAGMLGLAVLGILFNGAAVLRVAKGSSLTEQAVRWHLLEDTLGWVAVLAGAAAMAVWNLPIIDPLLSIAIALFVLWNVARNLRRFLNVFLQRAPSSFDADRFRRELLQVPGVTGVHHVHSWSIDGEKHVLTAHVVMAAGSPREAVTAAKRRVGELLDPQAYVHVAVDVELEGEACVAQAVRP